MDGSFALAELLGGGDKEEGNILTLVESRRGGGSVEYFCGEKDKGLEASKGGSDAWTEPSDLLMRGKGDGSRSCEAMGSG